MSATDKKSKQAVIAGAGPAGLTGAYELLKHTAIHPVVFEESNEIGGISRTVRRFRPRAERENEPLSTIAGLNEVL